MATVPESEPIIESTGQRTQEMARRGRFTANLASNLGGFCISVLIGIWYTPYLINHLGEASYGLIPLVTQITGYMTVLTLSLNSTVARYITIAIEQEDEQAANQYFNTSLFASLALAAGLIMPAVWVTLHIETLLKIPEDALSQTRWLFGFTAAAFVVNTVQTPFEIATYCLNRFDLRKSLDMLRQVVSVGVVILLFNVVLPRLSSVGIGVLAGAAVMFAGSVWLWRILTPNLRISVSCFRSQALKKLTLMGSWVALNAVGGMLFLAIDLLVVNLMFGPDAGGRYAPVLLWSTLLRSIGAVIASVFGPTILYYYARNDLDGLVVYTRRAMKCVGLLIALPVGGICGVSEPLLRTWLGPEWADLAWLMTLLTVHLSVNLAVLPLFSIQTATNRVRIPGLVTLAMGALNLGMALLLAGPAGWGLYGVAAAGAITLTAKNLLFTPIYGAHILGRPIGSFFREVLPIVGASLLVIVACKLLEANWDLVGWGRLIAAGTGVSLLYVPAVYFLLLTADDRRILRSLVPTFSR